MYLWKYRYMKYKWIFWDFLIGKIEIRGLYKSDRLLLLMVEILSEEYCKGSIWDF